MSGISRKASEIEDDDVAEENTTADSSRRLLLEALGPVRRDRILAALYLVRQDGIVIVRQTSMQIWKALVHNTPRTGTVIVRIFCTIIECFALVRELLPELVNQIIFLISSDEDEQQEVRNTHELEDHTQYFCRCLDVH